MTEISCHGRGAVQLLPESRTVVDMGGQDTKAIRVSPTGEIVDFCMNDKCAAGTEAFLEKTARYMGYGTEEIGPLMVTSREPVPISGVCAAFAESEVIRRRRERTSRRGAGAAETRRPAGWWWSG